jgi:hypothetical protein
VGDRYNLDIGHPTVSQSSDGRECSQASALPEPAARARTWRRKPVPAAAIRNLRFINDVNALRNIVGRGSLLHVNHTHLAETAKSG